MKYNYPKMPDYLKKRRVCSKLDVETKIDIYDMFIAGYKTNEISRYVNDKTNRSKRCSSSYKYFVSIQDVEVAIRERFIYMYLRGQK
jgi:hypothetical protein